MADLRETLKARAGQLDCHRRPNQRNGEQNTKVMLIEPVRQASSSLGLVGAATSSGYVWSGHGVIGLTESAALDRLLPVKS